MVNYRDCVLVPGLLILVLALIVFLSLPSLYQSRPGTSDDSTDYVTKVGLFEVRGNSLAPLIKPGQTIKLLYRYYDSHPVDREDIIAYDYAGNSAPIIKIVKAIPGDKWHLEKDDQRDSYQVIVNDKPLRNSVDRIYQIPESNIQMLKLYAKSYPTLPEDTYLLLGNQPGGSLDATRFGLIDRTDILGKVEIMSLKKR
ncbi:MAG: signal peptidase I [Candidatus Altiarchaeota archaeon]|nr:signal peptidase I [Candidatus Altiarchaeota archaeon]